MQYIFWVAILLGVMILVHELGHFWAALAVGVKVETFSIGFGTRLIGFRRGDTDFRISAIPLGGYVKMLGEQPGDDKALDPGSLQAKPRWQRAIVIIAGPLMNIILAVAIVTGLYMIPEVKDTLIKSVAPGSPAAEAGLKPGDKIVEVAGKGNPDWDFVVTKEAANKPFPVVVERAHQKFNYTVAPRVDSRDGVAVAGWGGEPGVFISQVTVDSAAKNAGLEPGDLMMAVNGRPVSSAITVIQAVTHSGGNPIQIEIDREGTKKTLSLTPVASKDPKLPYRIGVGFAGTPQKMGFSEAFVQSLRVNRYYAMEIFRILGSIVERKASPKALSGPIQMAVMSKETAQQGAWRFLEFMAAVSLNLAIFNLLPIPILDGGTLLLLLIEMLLQREVSLQIKETVFKLAFVFLMMVVVFVIYNDISKILMKG